MADPPPFVVGVVGSAGAVEALGELLTNIELLPWPEMAWVVAIHQPGVAPGGPDLCAEVLQRAVGHRSHVHVRLLRPHAPAVAIRPGEIYSCPPGCTVGISQVGEITCTETSRRGPLTLLSELISLAGHGTPLPRTSHRRAHALP